VSERHAAEVAIIGGGVIGLATAVRLAGEGREVVIVEPNEPGSGASYGNAGTIADYGVSPVGTPAVLRNLPALLFDRDSPLSIRLAALPALAPWLIRFAHQSLPERAKANAAAIARLLAEAVPGWQELAATVGAQDLLRQRGCLYVYDSKAAFAGAGWEIALRRQHAIRQEVLSPEAVAALEPSLPPFEGGGLFFSDAMNLSDPRAMMRRLAAGAEAAGASFLTASVGRIERISNGVRVTNGSFSLVAKTVVIAAGAHSKALAAQAGDRMPLDTERGYHVEYDMETPPVSRPVCPTSRGFYLVPMQGRLRVAGTVELGGVHAPANPRRIARLERGAKTVFPALGAPSRTWLGFRPSMPDSVPVIGPSRGGKDIILAFGHGHLGLTLAPTTARIVGDIVAGRSDPDWLKPYGPGRFS
jgi:D-hydroxyproline dehydrogenase